ncbi:MAG: chloramphenicol acetyltransferase [Anaerolineales bacterium]|jgi:chloramphenicol O-acetyltransferase type A
MRVIDLANWPRHAAFEKFHRFEMPHFNLTASVDVSSFSTTVKNRSSSFTVAVAYTLARAANEIEPFRLRIHGEQVVEYEQVHPSFTILLEDESFSFCMVPYTSSYIEFAAEAAQRIQHIRLHPTLQDEPGQDDLLFMTSIPWVSFTSMQHPMNLHPADSVPRIAWGKTYQDRDRRLMPLSVQVHHALMDGLHVGRYFERVATYMSNPEPLLE